MDQLWNLVEELYFIAFGPVLYDLYVGRYKMNFLECVGTIGCFTMHGLYRLAVIFFPVTLAVFRSSTWTYTKCFVIVYGLFLVARLIGRLLSPEYMKMIKRLQEHNEDPRDQSRVTKLFSKYNMSLDNVHGFQLDYPKKEPYIDEYRVHEDPLTIALGSLAIYFFGRHLIFPGSISVLKYFMLAYVNNGRDDVVQEYGASRIPVRTRKGNVIDTLFIDNRGKHLLGKNLIIVSDGNAGLCERGLSKPWIGAGHSVLCYNAPGIGESSGTPYYDQICDGAEAVMTLARKLGFEFNVICLYGWSIGGFASAWMAANYPVRGVVLDATFDKLLPLAENFVGKRAQKIVRYAVGNYFNMNVSKLLVKYDGPVTFFRRRYEEMILTDDEDGRKVNRLDMLIKDFFSIRYHFFNWTSCDDLVVDAWLEMDEKVRRELYNIDGMELDIHEYMPRDSESTKEYIDPVARDHIIRRICLWHIIEFETTHNAPVPGLRCMLPEPMFPADAELPPPPKEELDRLN